MTSNRAKFFRHLTYSHLIASYLSAISVTCLIVGFHPGKLLEYAFPIFLSPAAFPFLLVGLHVDAPQFLWVAVGCYVAFFVFVGALIYVSQVRLRRRVAAQFNELPAQAPLPLNYYSEVPVLAEPVGKLVVLAASCAAISLLLMMLMCAGVANELPLNFLIYVYPVPAFIAAVAGAIGCFRTKPHTPSRQYAMFALCVGLLVGSFATFSFYLRFTGLDKYG